MKFDVLTLFPEMFESLKQSIIGKAEEKELIEINLINIRDFSKDKHKKVDDTPYGGGAGMVIRPDVVYDAYKSIKDENAKVFLVLDNASVHEVGSLFDEIGIHPIWLPPHSSHFLQTLDLLLFAELKKAYSSLRTPLTRPKIEGKLLRILRAWNTAKYPLNIINAWKRAGITFRRGAKGSSFEDATFCLDIRRITILIKCNCSDAEKGLDGSWTQEIW